MGAVGAAPLPISFVQANINKDESDAKFRADAAAVFANTPDLVTFNEVAHRDSAVLAPAGYSIFRTPGVRTGWAPVVWRNAAWTAVDEGTFQISDVPAKFKRTRPLLGVRYANWVTLESPSGALLSVISSHIAPNSKHTAELLLPSLRKLAKLTDQLSLRGPVLLAGDFNMGYHSSRYNSRILAGAGLTNTYEMTGRSFATHKRGGTIDYIFLGPSGAFTVTDQYPIVMNSDHRMVVAHLQLAPLVTPGDPGAPGEQPLPVFSAGAVVADPRGTKAQRRVIRTLQVRAIRATPAGAAIHVASDKIRGVGLINALTGARQRGVNVTVITAKRQLGTSEQALRKLLGHRKTASSYFKMVDGVWRSASSRALARKMKGNRLRPTVLLISRTGATPAFGLVSNANLGLGPLRPHYAGSPRARVTTDGASYDTLYRSYLAVIGRGY